jgi:hypothetical protein
MKPKPHENGVLFEDKVSGTPELWRVVGGNPRGPPPEASRQYAETIERLRERQNDEGARTTRVSLIHSGESADSTVIEVERHD